MASRKSRGFGDISEIERWGVETLIALELLHLVRDPECLHSVRITNPKISLDRESSEDEIGLGAEMRRVAVTSSGETLYLRFPWPHLNGIEKERVFAYVVGDILAVMDGPVALPGDEGGRVNAVLLKAMHLLALTRGMSHGACLNGVEPLRAVQAVKRFVALLFAYRLSGMTLQSSIM